MVEKDIERVFCQLAKKQKFLCFKFTSPGNSGVPDRILITPEGHTIYVELKTESGKLSKLQKVVISKMEKQGADVHVLYGVDEVRDFFQLFSI